MTVLGSLRHPIDNTYTRRGCQLCQFDQAILLFDAASR